jgi:DNA-binding cell septation regulator SpoVG
MNTAENQTASTPVAPVATSSAGMDGAPSSVGGVDVGWVWREVRKRVFIKLPFSMGVADAMEAVTPITMEGDHFVVGLESRKYPLSSHLMATQVHNTIENILRSAAGRPIRFEVVEGTTLDDWHVVRERRNRAHSAVVAMAEQQAETHHFEDVLNQIVSELRQRITASRDRILPQVRARLLFEVVPSLADAEDMLFPDPESHEARRSMARAIDRVASFLEVTPVMLALEVERHRREHPVRTHRPAPIVHSQEEQSKTTSTEPQANSNA